MAQAIEPKMTTRPLLASRTSRSTPPPTTMPYSQKIIDEIAKTPKSLGTQLGRWAIHHDFSVVRISKALGVTRQTVYNWFLGKDIFPAYEYRAEVLLEILQKTKSADEAWRETCKVFNLKT